MIVPILLQLTGAPKDEVRLGWLWIKCFILAIIIAVVLANSGHPLSAVFGVLLMIFI
jgi:hypothetical protein